MNSLHSDVKLTLGDQFGQRVAARLTDGNDNLPHEVAERLKAVRMLALSRRKLLKTETAAAVVSQGVSAALQKGGERFGLWIRLGALLPLVALVAGLVSIEFLQDDQWATEVASVDAELLVDELPPAAYTDPGFLPYLRASGRD